MKEPDIIKIVNDGIVPRLNDLDLARDYNAGKLAEALSQRHRSSVFLHQGHRFSDDGEILRARCRIARRGHRDQTGALLRLRRAGLAHSRLCRRAGRHRQGGSEEVHVLPGRRGREIEHRKNRWTNICAANRACAICGATPRARSTACLREDPPKQGANVFLTIDARIQAIAEEALRAVSRAGAVVVDPNNGNILAMASVPSFDPNTFIPSIKAKDWTALQKDEGDPLVNRAISCLPPGSTFKLITSLAGLRGTKNLANAQLQLRRRRQLRRPLFPMLDPRKALTHGTHRPGRCDQGFV